VKSRMHNAVAALKEMLAKHSAPEVARAPRRLGGAG
jgi:hypothetical protein